MNDKERINLIEQKFKLAEETIEKRFFRQKLCRAIIHDISYGMSMTRSTLHYGEKDCFDQLIMALAEVGDELDEINDRFKLQ